jgi:hypothetical protein
MRVFATIYAANGRTGGLIRKFVIPKDNGGHNERRFLAPQHRLIRRAAFQKPRQMPI